MEYLYIIIFILSQFWFEIKQYILYGKLKDASHNV
jgi:hypothetical protein